jgi:hypothetical protein
MRSKDDDTSQVHTPRQDATRPHVTRDVESRETSCRCKERYTYGEYTPSPKCYIKTGAILFFYINKTYVIPGRHPD